MGPQSKPSSRWGSFLQQAVAGVESRLDTILADEDQNSTSAAGLGDKHAEKSLASDAQLPPKNSADLSRHSSLGGKNARLQERLAKAVVNRSTNSKLSAALSGTDTLPVEQGSSRSSLDTKKDESFNEDSEESAAKAVAQEHLPVASEGQSIVETIAAPSVHPIKISQELRPTSSSGPGNGLSQTSDTRDQSVALSTIPDGAARANDSEILRKIRHEYEDLEIRRQEENTQNSERIESLEAKLQFLIVKVLERARGSANDTDSGAVEKEIAEKDNKIALLMEEGQRLSRNELKLSTNIKKLRSRLNETDKRILQLNETNDRLQGLRDLLENDLKQTKLSHSEVQERVSHLEKEIESAHVKSLSQTSKLDSLQKQLTEARDHHSQKEQNDYMQKADVERKRAETLQEKLATQNIERKLAEDRYRNQIREIQEAASTERKRSKALDLGLRGEIKTLEGRLETYRNHAEEISSGTGGESQAKLFRQIEILQSQYNVASDNWRGIEGALLARVTDLEKDRDELGRKEAELRRKAREANTKCRRMEEELERAQQLKSERDELLEAAQTQTAMLEGKLSTTEAIVESSRHDLELAKEELRLLRLDAENRDTRNLELPMEDSHAPSPASMSGKVLPERPAPDKPVFTRKSFGGLGLGLSGAAVPIEHSASRRESAQGSFANTRRGSFASTNDTPARMIMSPSHMADVHVEQQEDLFDGVVTPATPDKTINDMFSASTAGAGPSVQLVERMSATVRRLENEKEASKDEMKRLAKQRDEAREQIVSLMKETEEKRSSYARISSLEEEVERLNKRYQTTLEMLGEKSERVEELQADITDMKQIYRDVLQKTIE